MECRGGGVAGVSCNGFNNYLCDASAGEVGHLVQGGLSRYVWTGMAGRVGARNGDGGSGMERNLLINLAWV